MEEYSNMVPENTRFSIGFFEGRGSSKRWLINEEDLKAMYEAVRDNKEITLWCDGIEEKEQEKE